MDFSEFNEFEVALGLDELRHRAWVRDADRLNQAADVMDHMFRNPGIPHSTDYASSEDELVKVMRGAQKAGPQPLQKSTNTAQAVPFGKIRTDRGLMTPSEFVAAVSAAARAIR